MSLTSYRAAPSRAKFLLARPSPRKPQGVNRRFLPLKSIFRKELRRAFRACRRLKLKQCGPENLDPPVCRES